MNVNGQAEALAKLERLREAAANYGAYAIAVALEQRPGWRLELVRAQQRLADAIEASR